MSLRSEAIEAMAAVLKTDEYPVRDEPLTIHQLVASYVLDALLDYLTEHRKEWWDAWTARRDPETGDLMFVGLLSVLRVEEGDTK